MTARGGNRRNLTVSINSEARQYDRGFQRAQRTTQSFSQQIDQANRTGISRFNSNMDVATQRLRGFVGIAAGALAGGAIVRWAQGARDSANALTESVNAVRVVFGEASDDIVAFGEQAADSVGLAQSEFQELATPIGSILQEVGGFSAQEAAEGAIELTQRAADLASVFNTDVPEALGAIQAALRGESDPIERFGASINAAAVESFLLEEGLVASKGAIEDTDKVLGRFRLVLDQTDRVAGDFANTADSNANATRIFNARLEDLRAEVGQNVVTLFDDLIGKGNDLLPVLESLGEDVLPVLVDIFGDFIEGIFTIGEGIAGLPDAVKLTSGALLGLAGAAKLAVANPIVAGLGAVAVGIAAIGDAARQEQEQVDELKAAIEELATTGSDEQLFAELKEDIGDLLNPQGGRQGFQLSTVIQDLADDLGLSAGEFSDTIRDTVNRVGLSLDDLAEFAAGDEAAFERVTGAFDSYAERLAESGQIDPDLPFVEQQLFEIRDRYLETAQAVEEQRDAERALNDEGELSDKRIQQRTRNEFDLAAALRGRADQTEELTEAQQRELDKTAELNRAVGELAIKYQDQLAGAVEAALNPFEELGEADPEDVLSPDELVANAEEGLRRSQEFLSGINRLREEGLSPLALQFTERGLTADSLAELQGLLSDLDEGGAAAFELNELVDKGGSEIGRLTASLAEDLAREKEPLLTTAQQVGVDIGEAIAQGVEQVNLEFSLRVGALSQSGSRQRPRFSDTPSGGRQIEGLAAGGRVNPLQPYLVGERRAEVFVPDRSGTIVPSVDQFASMLRQGPVGSGGGGGVPPVSVSVDARGSTDPNGVAFAIRRELSRELRNFEAGQDRRI